MPTPTVIAEIDRIRHSGVPPALEAAPVLPPAGSATPCWPAAKCAECLGGSLGVCDRCTLKKYTESNGK